MSKGRSKFGRIKFYDKSVQDMLKSNGVEEAMKNKGKEIANEIHRTHPEYNMSETTFVGPRRSRVWIGTKNSAARYKEAYDGVMRRAGLRWRQ